MRATLLIPLVFLVVAAPAYADDQADPAATARQEANGKATAFLREKRPGAALGVLDAIMPAVDAEVAETRKKSLAFCSTSLTEALIYSMLGTKVKKDAVVLGRDVCDTYYVYAFALMDVGRIAEAITVWEKLTALAPMHSAYFSELGFAYRTNKQIEKAVAAYKQAVDFANMAGDKTVENFERGRALRGLGFIKVDLGDLDAGEKYYREALKFDPENVTTKAELKYIADQRVKKK